MKMKKALLLSLLSLTLAGCSSGESSGKGSEPGASDSGEIGNTKTDTPTDGDSGNEGDTPSGGGGETPDDGGGDDTPKEEVNDTFWDDNVWALMKKYLGGHVLPFFEIGRGYTATYKSTSTTRPYLLIECAVAWGDSFKADFENEYENAGWELGKATSTSDSADLEAEGLSVTLGKDTSGLGTIKAYYDESYNEDNLKDWTDDVKTYFNNYNDSHILPYVYLGSANPIASYSSNKLTIAGGKWDERIATNAETILKGEDYTVTNVPDKYSSVITATKVLDDKCEVTIVIDAYNSTSYPRTNYTVTITEGYNPDAYTGWKSAFDEYKNTNLGGHDIPAFYLGTTGPSFDWNKTYNRLMVTGKDFKDEIIELAKNKLDENWTYWSSTENNSPSLYCRRKFDDGCRVQCKIFKNTSSKAILYIHYDTAYTTATTDTDWSEDVKTDITTNLGAGVTIPFVDLGKDGATSKWYPASKKLTITGAAPNNSAIPEAAIEAFKAAGWKTTIVYSSTGYGLGMNATITTSLNDTLTATISNVGSTTTSPSLSITLDEGYKEADKQSAWTDEIQKLMTTNYNYVFPYVYLGTRVPYPTYTTASGKLLIKGGTWNDQIYTDFETAFKADTKVTWTVAEKTHTTYGKTLVATGKVGNDNFTVTVYHSNATTPIPYIEIVSADAFEVPADGAWDDTQKTTMKTNYDNYEAPYVYLGTDSPTFGTPNTTTKAITITGGTWNTEVITSARKQLETEGFTVEQGRGYYGGACLYAYRLYDDGHSFTYYIYRSAISNGKIMCQLLYGKAPSTDTSGDKWSSANETLINDNLQGYDLPYISTGATQMTAAKYSSTKGDGALTFTFTSNTNKDWTISNIYKAVQVLKKDNPNWNIHFNYPNVSSTSLSAYGSMNADLQLDDGSMVYIRFYGSTFSKAYMYVSYFKYDAPTSGSWSDEVKSTVAAYGNGLTLPYLYLGTDSPTATASASSSSTSGTTTSKVTFTGGCFSEKIFTDAEAVLKAETAMKWSVMYDVDASGKKSLIATATATDGSMVKLTISWSYYSTNGEMRTTMTLICI